MSEINKTNKKDIPLWVCFLTIIASALLAYYNQLLGAVVFLPASILAYYADSKIKYPITSVIVFLAGIGCYILNYSSAPLYSTLCLVSAFSAFGCILTNIIFKNSKFFEGLVYSIVLGIIMMVLSAVAFYYIDGEKQLIDAALINIEDYLSTTNSMIVNSFMAAITRNMEILESNGSIMELLEPARFRLLILLL